MKRRRLHGACDLCRQKKSEYQVDTGTPYITEQYPQYDVRGAYYTVDYPLNEVSRRLFEETGEQVLKLCRIWLGLHPCSCQPGTRTIPGEVCLLNVHTPCCRKLGWDTGRSYLLLVIKPLESSYSLGLHAMGFHPRPTLPPWASYARAWTLYSRPSSRRHIKRQRTLPSFEKPSLTSPGIPGHLKTPSYPTPRRHPPL